MDFRRLMGWGLAGAGVLAYGALFETDRLVGERVTLRLRDWPREFDGYRVGLMSDFHFRGAEELALARTAMDWLIGEDPDAVVLAGDFIPWWDEGVLERVQFGLEGLEFFAGRGVAVPGNHDYYGGDAGGLGSVLEGFGVAFLRNSVYEVGGVQFLGIDSSGGGHADPFGTVLGADATRPMVAVWHEPDMVDWLPKGVDLMLSGHSHGGQFCSPWGWAPMKTRLGAKYVRGFYRNAPVPIYVSRGLATTGPGARLYCRPEVTVLTLVGG